MMNVLFFLGEIFFFFKLVDLSPFEAEKKMVKEINVFICIFQF